MQVIFTFNLVQPKQLLIVLIFESETCLNVANQLLKHVIRNLVTFRKKLIVSILLPKIYYLNNFSLWRLWLIDCGILATSFAIEIVAVWHLAIIRNYHLFSTSIFRFLLR